MKCSSKTDPEVMQRLGFEEMVCKIGIQIYNKVYSRKADNIHGKDREPNRNSQDGKHKIK